MSSKVLGDLFPILSSFLKIQKFLILIEQPRFPKLFRNLVSYTKKEFFNLLVTHAFF